MPTERSPRRLSSVGDKDADRSRRHRLQDALPLETSPASDAKPEPKIASHISDKKADELGEKTKNSDQTTVSRSRSFQQHDERGSAAQDGRRSGRRMTSERGWWNNSRDEDRATHRTSGSYLKEEEKPRARGGDGRVWQHDRFSEVDANADPPAKKRRQFREEKLPLVSEYAGKAVAEPSKDSQPFSSNVDAGREERARDRRPLERREYDRAYVRERSYSNRGRVEKTDYFSRGRFNGGDSDARYRGRENFSGRQGYQSSGGRVEKWKHDLFDEANRSPPTKNEEDPVAKVEALLSL